MKKFLRSLPKQSPLSWAVTIVIFLLTVAATVTLFIIVHNDTYQEIENRFEFRVDEINSAIKNRMLTYEQVLLGGVGLFQSSDTVSRDEWRMYVDALNLDTNLPGILGIGFAKVIYPGELDNHISRIRSEGFPDYTVWPEGERDFYTSIIYLEPFNWRNRRAFGYDMFSEPVRRKAMAAARDNGKTSISGRITLVQETNKDVQFGFLMYLPLYKAETPETLEEKRNQLLGFVYSPFRINDLMAGILGPDLLNLQLRIYDGLTHADTTIMYNSSPVTGSEEHNAKFISIDTLEIHGKEWMLHISSLPQFEELIDTSKPNIILYGGIFLALLLSSLSYSVSISRRLTTDLERLLEATSEGVFGIDLEGRCTFMNRAASEMLKISPSDCLKRKVHEIIHYKKVDGTEYPLQSCPIFTAMNRKEGCHSDDEVFWRSDGTYFYVEYSSNPIIVGDKIKGSVVTFSDVTSRKASEKLIDASLKEKEVLLREIHHRVKNNLQVISSLFTLQSNYIKDELIHDIFKDSQNRVKTMALVHEKLYQNENIGTLNVAEYVRDLINNLIRAYRKDIHNVNFIIDSEDIALGIDISINLGIIINELVSNALKHAFKDGESGEVRLSLTKEDEDILRLIVADNGKGIPPEIDYTKTESLGMQLIIALTEQLNGTIELDRTKGTKFKIDMHVLKQDSKNKFDF